jgi:hypothetical protein
MTVPTRQRRTRKVTDYIVDQETGERTEGVQEVVIDQEACEARALAEDLTRRFTDQVDFILAEYHEDKDGKWTPDRARQYVAEKWGTYDLEKIKNLPPHNVLWSDLTAVLASHGMEAAVELWREIKATARSHIESGAHVAETVYPNASPLDRAKIFALREELVDGWKPQNGIEHALMDMMCLSYSLYLYWTAIAHERVMRTADDYKEQKKGSPIWSEGKWNLPTIYESQAVDQANRLADGYHRQFMRTLRQLRDLRRYIPPVIVNNGGQVNVAANGGHQVNLTS